MGSFAENLKRANTNMLKVQDHREQLNKLLKERENELISSDPAKGEFFHRSNEDPRIIYEKAERKIQQDYAHKIEQLLQLDMPVTKGNR